MNMTLSTSTRIAPIVDVSTYEGPFSYDSLWQDEEDAEREEGRFVCDDYDFSKMGERIVEEANKVFAAEKPLSQYGVVSIKATSPTRWRTMRITPKGFCLFSALNDIQAECNLGKDPPPFPNKCAIPLCILNLVLKEHGLELEEG